MVINNRKELLDELRGACHANLTAFVRYLVEKGHFHDDELVLPKDLYDELMELSCNIYEDAGETQRFANADASHVICTLDATAVLDPVVFDWDKEGT